MSDEKKPTVGEDLVAGFTELADLLDENARLRARIVELESLLCCARDACPCARSFEACATCRRINALVGLSPEDREKLERLHAEATEQRKTDGPWLEFTGDGE